MMTRTVPSDTGGFVHNKATSPDLDARPRTTGVDTPANGPDAPATGPSAPVTGQAASGPGRRSVVVLGAAATLGVVGAAGLAACGSSPSATTAAPMPAASDATVAAAAPMTSAEPMTSATAKKPAAGMKSAAPPKTAAAADGGTAALAKLKDVPVGHAIAASGPEGQPIVIARPKTGKVVAFSAICTHQGCTVAPAGKQLNCPCHGSVFDAFTGKVLAGPAPSPLPAVAVKVSGANVVAG